MIKKENLPQKVCVVCQKPFVWRRKWKKVWDEVKYCSEKCRRNRKNSAIVENFQDRDL